MYCAPNPQIKQGRHIKRCICAVDGLDSGRLASFWEHLLPILVVHGVRGNIHNTAPKRIKLIRWLRIQAIARVDIRVEDRVGTSYRVRGYSYAVGVVVMHGYVY